MSPKHHKKKRKKPSKHIRSDSQLPEIQAPNPVPETQPLIPDIKTTIGLQHGVQWGRMAKYIPLFLLLLGTALGTGEWINLYNNANIMPLWLAVIIPLFVGVICLSFCRFFGLNKTFALIVVLGVSLSLWIPRSLNALNFTADSGGWCRKTLLEIITDQFVQRSPKTVSIVVAKFKGPGQGDNIDPQAVTDTIINRLRRETREFSEVEIKPLGKKITEEDNLQEIFKELRRCNNSVLIWGFYDETSNVTVHIERLRESSLIPPRTDTSVNVNLEFDYTASMAEKQGITVKDALSGDMNFFSLLIVGLIRYEAKDFDGALLRFSKAQDQSTSTTGSIYKYIFSYFLGNAFFHLGRYAEAAHSYENAMNLDNNDTDTLNNLALSLEYTGDYPKAEALFKRALALEEKERGEGSAALFNNLGGLYRNQGKYAEAEPLFKRALAIEEAATGTESSNIAGFLNNLAAVYLDQGRADEAEPLFKRALKILEGTREPKDPYVATTLSNLAGLYRRQKKYEEAELYLKRALEIDEKALGPEHPNTALIIINLASLYKLQGRNSEAEPLFKRGLLITEKTLGAEHSDLAPVLIDFAELYLNIGRVDEAERLFKRALAIAERSADEKPLTVAAALDGLATLYFSHGNFSKADPLLSRSLVLKEHSLGPEHIRLVPTLNYLGGIRASEGKYAEAETIFKRALIITEKDDKEGPFVPGALKIYADILRKMNRNEEAEVFEKKAGQIESKLKSQN